MMFLRIECHDHVDGAFDDGAVETFVACINCFCVFAVLIDFLLEQGVGFSAEDRRICSCTNCMRVDKSLTVTRTAGWSLKLKTISNTNFSPSHWPAKWIPPGKLLLTQ